ncbi:DUF663 and AARP2CN domain containing protein [Trichuris trichiura]|uniref:Pre-rRNA-processing protein TSR1 homolog n=1 Tax=Trichuris trichiura TaxID=36087 RepID=A0A077Z856_TRITR|nr:DUF663 and AARP2CN domain containing protein [Trichuris trichiura]
MHFCRLPERRSRFCFLCPDAINMVDVLDSLKVLTLRNNSKKGIVSLSLAMKRLPFKNIIRFFIIKWSVLCSSLSYCFAYAFSRGLKGRFYKLDTVKEQDALLRLMSSCSTKPLSLQEYRTRLLVESCTITGLCTLRLCGYVRGPSLDVNRLVHIPGWGDYQLTSVDVLLDPHPLHEFQQAALFSNYLHYDQFQCFLGDFMQHPKHLFPKGTSEYQATWMMDLQECAENTLESENVVTVIFIICVPISLVMNVTAGNFRLARVREEREDKLFPDEIDTPAHEPARIRFQKYRSLKSFRTSFWDPKENLPRDYIRIVHFKNFSVTKKRILEQEVKGAVVSAFNGLYSFLCNFSHPLVVYSLLPNEQKMALLNVLLRKHSLCDQPIRSKDELLFQIGYRRYFVSPVFSQHTIADKHKVERFLPENATVVASFFAPVMFPPAGVSVFKLGQLSLVGTGSLMNVDADRVILKRVVLSGHPYKINRRHAVVRYMFFNRDDVEWFRPVELRTRSGRRGYIREPIGTHGYMKCSFNAQLPSQDVVFIDLYKRVFPKWTYDPLVDQRLFAETCSKMDSS